jgi:hypothetical protein
MHIEKWILAVLFRPSSQEMSIQRSCNISTAALHIEMGRESIRDKQISAILKCCRVYCNLGILKPTLIPRKP